MTDREELRRGAGYAIAAYAFWGLAPLYFKLLGSVAATDILGHRVLWSVLLLAVVLTVLGTWSRVVAVVLDPRARRWLLLSALLIGINWGVFILAVVTDRVLEASLGYYVNPLLSTCLGLVLLGERLNTRQWLAVALAAAGTAWLALGTGGLPLISIVLALTFAAYGLVRKLARVEAVAGLFIEALLLAPFALAWLLWLESQGRGAFGHQGLGTSALLVLSGAVTTIPLLWFVGAARRLPLATVGFFQYLAPTLQLLLAVLLFGEPFGSTRAVAFALIWSAVGLYIYDTLRALRTDAARNEGDGG